MKTIDYFFETYIEPIGKTYFELGEFILNCVLFLVLLITTPIWVIPYLIIKKRG